MNPWGVVSGSAFDSSTFRLKPETAKKIHLYLMVIWIVIGIPVSFLLRQQLPWLVFLSVYAIIVGHAAGWSAERPTEIRESGE